MLPEILNSVESDCGNVSEKVKKAYLLASKSHEGQFRKSGEPYFSHCLAVFKILRDEWGIDQEEYLIAALLHDVVEDTNITLHELRMEFGDNVAELVEGVTKLSEGSDKDTLAKVLEKTYLNPGVAIVKLADRLHNMRTLEHMKPIKQIEKSTETLDVYARLAESLGMWQVKRELEDLCYQYLDPSGYEETKQQIDSDSRSAPLFVSYLESRVQQLLVGDSFHGEVEVRNNGYWALKNKQRKLSLQGKCSPDGFEEINDVISLRVVLPETKDCYSFLRILHESFGEMVDYDRYDEFIGANKRVNGYQALQTTINSPQGPVEIAMVTPKMEEFNNWGVVELIRNNQPSLKEYVLKLVFTPSGSLRFMPKEATGVDFANSISPRVLAEAKSILINGVENPISTVIPNASTVEVNIGELRRAPIQNVESYCLPTTRKDIMELRRQEKKDVLIEKGKNIVEQLLSPRGLLDLTDLGSIVNPILYSFGCQGCGDLYFMLGNGSIKTSELESKFDDAQITKKDLALSTIRLSGKDQPKILIDIVKTISAMDTSIVRINQNNKANEKVGDTFNLRIVVKGLTREQEEELSKVFSKDSRFDLSLVV